MPFSCGRTGAERSEAEGRAVCCKGELYCRSLLDPFPPRRQHALGQSEEPSPVDLDWTTSAMLTLTSMEICNLNRTRPWDANHRPDGVTAVAMLAFRRRFCRSAPHPCSDQDGDPSLSSKNTGTSKTRGTSSRERLGLTDSILPRPRRQQRPRGQLRLGGLLAATEPIPSALRPGTLPR